MKLSKKLKFKTNKTLKLSKARLPNVVVIQSVPLTETFTIFNFFYHRFRYSTYCAGWHPAHTPITKPITTQLGLSSLKWWCANKPPFMLPINIIKVVLLKFMDQPRHRGLGEEWTTSVHSFGRVDGSHPGLGKFFYLKDPKKSPEEKSSRIVRAWEGYVKKAGAARGNEETGRRTWNGYENWFGSSRRRLNGECQARNDMEWKI